MSFDPQELAAQFVRENLPRILTIAGTAAKAGAKNIALKFQPTYSKYLSRLLIRYEKFKPFLIQEGPLPIESFYVPVDIKTNQKVIKDPDLTKIINCSNFTAITGLGGSGKSVLLRSLLLQSLRANKRIPIFFELRDLNEEQKPLMDGLRAELSDSGFPFGAEHFEILLRAGEFIIFLDGLDEVDPMHANKVAREINKIAKKYPNNPIIASSRPDARVKGWPQFSIFEMAGLTLEGARSLIQKLPYDHQTKEAFLRRLNVKFYKDHEHFASNPLLLSIMLLTFGQIADVPEKMSVFLGQAFEVLFHRHDASKGGTYKRRKKTGMDVLDFSRLLSLFCLVSYDKRAFSFSRPSALEMIQTAASLNTLEVHAEDFLDDLCQAVCLLIEDGQSIAFAHRLFQEYFVAVFISQASDSARAELLKKFRQSAHNDRVIPLLMEMRPDIVEKYYILPSIIELRRKYGIKKKANLKHVASLLSETFEYVLIFDHAEKASIGFLGERSSEAFWRLLFIGWMAREVLRVPKSDHVEEKSYADLIEAVRVCGVKIEVDKQDRSAKVKIKDLIENSAAASIFIDRAFLGVEQLQRVLDQQIEIERRIGKEGTALDKILKE